MGVAAAPVHALCAAFGAGRYVRAVNFHATPDRARLERQLAAIAERYVALGEDDLAELFATGPRPDGRPGVLLAFYNGYRNNLEVAAPALERMGLVGWFFVPSAFVLCPPAEQRAFAAAHRIDLRHAGDGERVAIDPQQLRTLARRHVVASHTHTHRALSRDLGADELAEEVAGSRAHLSRLAGRPVRAFAWLYGAALGDDPEIDDALAAAGYEFLFANHTIQRLRPPPPAPAGA